MECEKILEKLRTDSVVLISAVWSGINWEGVNGKRRMNIYEEFSNKIKSSSQTGKLSHFLEKLCQKMDSRFTSATSDNVLRIIREIEKDDLDLEILDVMRAETELLILLMREKNNEGKETKEEEKVAEKKAQKTLIEEI